MKQIRTFLLAAAFLPAAPAAVAWTQISGPTPGYLSIALDSSETKRIVALEQGGFWKTVDSGESWFPINELIFDPDSGTIADLQSIESFDPDLDTLAGHMHFNPPTRYEWMISSDGGESWRAVFPYPNAGSFTSLLTVDRLNLSNLLLMTARTINLSADFGYTWETFEYDDHSNQEFAFIQDRVQDSTFYFSGFGINQHFYPGVYRSTDYCRTWERVLSADTLYSSPHPFNQRITQLSNDDLIAVASFMGDHFLYGPYYSVNFVVRSSDRGESWELGPDVFPSWMNPSIIKEDPHDNGTVYVLGDPGFRRTRGMFQSNDYGYSFQRNPNGLPADIYHVGDISINRFNRNAYLCSSERGIWRTEDGGNSWHPFEMGLPFGRLMNFSIVGDEIFARGFQDLAFYSYDIEESEWNEIHISSSQSDTIMYPMSYVLKSPDRWVAFEDITYFSIDTESSLFQPMESFDEGLSWQPFGEALEPGLEFYRRTIQAQLYADEAFTRLACSRKVGDTWTTDVSIDSGRTWQSTADWPFIVSFGQTREYIVAASTNGIFRSDDNGATWQDMGFIYLPQLNSPTTPILVDPLDSSIYLFGTSRLYRFLDGTWNFVRGLGVQPISATLLSDEPGRLLISRWGTGELERREYLSYSYDGGANWTNIEPLLDAIPYRTQFLFLRDLKYDAERNRVWLSTPIGLMYMDSDQITSAPENPISLLPQDHILLSAYPNPFNSETRVTITIGQPGEVMLKVYDIQGREVARPIHEAKQPGVYNLTLNGSTWPSGTYFLHLETDSRTVTKKITLVK